MSRRTDRVSSKYLKNSRDIALPSGRAIILPLGVVSSDDAFQRLWPTASLTTLPAEVGGRSQCGGRAARGEDAGIEPAVGVALGAGERDFRGVADDDHLAPIDRLTALGLHDAAQLPSPKEEIERARHGLPEVPALA